MNDNGHLTSIFGGDLFTVEEFRNMCADGFLTNYDGYGYPVKDMKANDNIIVLPSKLEEIPEDCTHIVWFNR